MDIPWSCHLLPNVAILMGSDKATEPSFALAVISAFCEGLLGSLSQLREIQLDGFPTSVSAPFTSALGPGGLIVLHFLQYL